MIVNMPLLTSHGPRKTDVELILHCITYIGPGTIVSLFLVGLVDSNKYSNPFYTKDHHRLKSQYQFWGIGGPLTLIYSTEIAADAV